MQAALSVVGKTKTLRETVYEALAQTPMTDEQIAVFISVFTVAFWAVGQLAHGRKGVQDGKPARSEHRWQAPTGAFSGGDFRI